MLQHQVDSGLRITYALVARMPAITADPDPLAACRGSSSQNLLGCAFASWMRRLEPADNVGILLDASNRTEEEFDLSRWLASLGPQAPTVRSQITREPGCEVRPDRRVYCLRGTAQLLPFALRAFPTTLLFVKVDTDTVVLPERVRLMVAGVLRARGHEANRAAWVRAYESRSPLTSAMLNPRDAHDPSRPARLYMGDSTHTTKFVRDAPMRRSHDWKVLETELGWDMSPAALAGRCELVGYAKGAVYFLSQGAVSSIVRHDCLGKFGQLQCGEPDRPKMCEFGPRHEDVAVGLCAHLHSAESILAVCLQLNHNAGREHPISHGCPTPLTVHSLKKGEDYLAMWERLHPANLTRGAPSDVWHSLRNTLRPLPGGLSCGPRVDLPNVTVQE